MAVAVEHYAGQDPHLGGRGGGVVHDRPARTAEPGAGAGWVEWWVVCVCVCVRVCVCVKINKVFFFLIDL